MVVKNVKNLTGKTIQCGELVSFINEKLTLKIRKLDMAKTLFGKVVAMVISGTVIWLIIWGFIIFLGIKAVKEVNQHGLKSIIEHVWNGQSQDSLKVK